jgi:hypothetical protein
MIFPVKSGVLVIASKPTPQDPINQFVELSFLKFLEIVHPCIDRDECLPGFMIDCVHSMTKQQTGVSKGLRAHRHTGLNTGATWRAGRQAERAHQGSSWTEETRRGRARPAAPDDDKSQASERRRPVASWNSELGSDPRAASRTQIW